MIEESDFHYNCLSKATESSNPEKVTLLLFTEIRLCSCANLDGGQGLESRPSWQIQISSNLHYKITKKHALEPSSPIANSKKKTRPTTPPLEKYNISGSAYVATYWHLSLIAPDGRQTKGAPLKIFLPSVYNCNGLGIFKVHHSHPGDVGAGIHEGRKIHDTEILNKVTA